MALSTIGTAAIADDAITSAKVDSTTAAFTVADLVVTNGITAGTSINAGTELVGNVSGRILLDASAAATDVGDEFLLNATDASASNDGSKILFEEGTDDGSIASNKANGSILQMIQAPVTDNMITTTKGSFVDTNYVLNITPTSSGSKVLIDWTCPWNITGTGAKTRGAWKLVRTVTGGATTTILNTYDYDEQLQIRNTNNQWNQVYAGHFLDSPNTTAVVEYKFQIILKNDSGITSFTVYPSTYGGAMNLKEIAG